MFLCTLLAACSWPAEDIGGGGSGGSGGGGGTTEAGAGGAPALPRIEPVPPTAPVVCAGGLRPKAYMIGYDSMLFDFDPDTLEMRLLGNLACPTTGVDPMEMTVSQAGVAYVLYHQDATIYRVDLETLACTRTPYMDGQLGFSIGTMVIPPGGDRLYMLGTLGDMSTPTLAVADLVDFQVHVVGDIEPVFWTSDDSLVNAQMDAFGRLFALTFHEGNLVQIDPTAGAVVAEDQTGDPDGYGACGATGLLTYDDAFYLLGSCENDVVHYDLATGTLEPTGTLIENILAMSAMPCVPSAPPWTPTVVRALPEPPVR